MYIQNDPRRWKERADGSMVNEDHAATANLSPRVMIRPIPHHDIPSDPCRSTRLLVEDKMDPSSIPSLAMAFMDKVKASKRL